VSLVTVLSFESVGAVLVVGFLVVPPATAFLISDNLIKMHILSLVITTLTVFIGYILAVYLNLSISPTIVTFGGIVFFLTFVTNSLGKRKSVKVK
jgi:manganese/zinc/iron transport system permease protein